MKIQEIKEMPVVELQVKSRDLRASLFSLNLEKSLNPKSYDKAHRIRHLRRDIARVETVLTRIKKQEAQA